MIPRRSWQQRLEQAQREARSADCPATQGVTLRQDPAAFDSSALQVFRGYYPKGRSFLVTPSGDPAFTRRFGKLEVRVCTPAELHS